MQVGKLSGSRSQVGDLPTCQLREFLFMRKNVHSRVQKCYMSKGPKGRIIIRTNDLIDLSDCNQGI